MEIPEKFIENLIKQSDFPLFLFECNCFPNEENFTKIIENDDLSTVVKLLKFKLILIHKKKLNPYDYDIDKLCNRVPKDNFILLHDILFFSLLIKPDIQNLLEYLNQSCNIITTTFKESTDINLLLHHLEIIDVVLEICELLKIVEIKEEANLKNLILNLICNDENNIWRKISTDIIPKYILCTNDNNLFSKIWFEIKNSNVQNYILLALENYFIPEVYDEKSFNILNEEDFWIYLQNKIYSSDVFAKKQAHYLLKKSIQTLFYNRSYLTNYNLKFSFLNWDRNNLDEFKNAWKNFFILCEVSNEKQVHLIEPTFKLYTSLKPLHISWKNKVTKLFILHPHSAVVRLTVFHILRGLWNCDIKTLIQGLNNNFLYENFINSEFNNYLTVFMSKLTIKELALFIQQICNENMSPVPFYYVSKTISLCELKNLELKYLIDFIILSEKVPHLYIRKGIMHYLFISFTKILEHCNENITDEFIKIINLFYNNKYLQRGNESWNQLLLLLYNIIVYNNILNLKFIADFYLLEEEYSVFIILLIDLHILNKNWFINYLNYIFKQQNLKNKLYNYKILFEAINASKICDELFDDNYFSNDDIHKIFDDLFHICYNNENYTVEFFDKIGYIIKTCMYQVSFDIVQMFFELLQQKNFLSYFMLILNFIEICEINRKKINCIDILTKISYNLKKYKTFCDNELNLYHKNTIKQKLLLNYYYAKLNLEKLFIQISDKKEINNEFIQKIHEYYDRGGQNIIILVLDTLNVIIYKCNFTQMPTNFVPDFLTLLHRCQKDIFNSRTNKNFRPAITKFISIILHLQIFQHEILKEFSYNFCLSMFDSSQIIIGIRNEILNKIRIPNLTPEIVVEGLLFGQILRKDQRIEFETCNLISKEIQHLQFSLDNPCELDSRVRTKSVSLLLLAIYTPNNNYNSKQFCEDVYKLLVEKYNQTAGKRYFGDSQIHVTKLRILQSLHVIIPKLEKNVLCDIKDWLFDCLVNESQQPSIKILIQWLMIRIYNIIKGKEEIVKKLFDKITNLKGTSCASIFPLFYHIVKDKNVKIDTVYDIIEFLLPFTMGQQFSIRLIAQVTIKHIYDIYSDDTEFSKQYHAIYKTVTDVINQTSIDKISDNILPFSNISPSIQTLYYDIPRLTNVTPTEWLPPHLFTRVLFMKLTSNDGLEKLEFNKKQLQPSYNDSDSDNMNVQKKIDVCNLTENSPDKNIIGNLVVVASLIDKVPNLGGLSRTCEVFGVAQYVLNNIQYMKNKEYQSLSMSSEKWLKMLEVKAENLSAYLIEMKKKNYRIIGAEQTSDSKQLNTYKYTANTVLLLGNEKEGIPPNLIHLLDDCIEIPQFGQIRSLNVHVAGSLFIWEYVKQHCSTIT